MNMSLKIGKHFEVFRSSETIKTTERLPIILAVGQAFGSGEHETTSSCLEELESIPAIRGTKVLDVGSGTGILAIAAVHLGARSVTAVDPKPEAIKVTAASIKLNRMEDKIIPLKGEVGIVQDVDFDIIMANLYGDILLEIGREISTRLKAGGYLLLSGILYEYTYDLKRLFMREGCEQLKARYLEEYTTLLFRKR